MYYTVDDSNVIVMTADAKATIENHPDHNNTIYETDEDIRLEDNTDTKKWQHDPETGEPFFGAV